MITEVINKLSGIWTKHSDWRDITTRATCVTNDELFTTVWTITSQKDGEVVLVAVAYDRETGNRFSKTIYHLAAKDAAGMVEEIAKMMDISLKQFVVINTPLDFEVINYNQPDKTTYFILKR